MNYTKLIKLRDCLYFTIEDVADIFAIKESSARVLCSRYVRKGLFVRLKNNFYILDENWQRYSMGEYLKISNFLQVPSYISFMTALSFYQVTTQIQRSYYESVSLKRSAEFSDTGKTFIFRKVKKEYYFDFVKLDDIFIATKEKAFIDSAYLYSFGKYKFDLSSINLEKLNMDKLKEILKVFPLKTRRVVKRLCGI